MLGLSVLMCLCALEFLDTNLDKQTLHLHKQAVSAMDSGGLVTMV